MNEHIQLVKGMAVIAAALLFWGCTTANNDAVTVNASGQHVADWINMHRAAFLENQTPCYDCHGKDLRGGISKVSCFSAMFGGMTCHAQGPSGHPDGWRDPSMHGAAAKSQPGLYTGFSSCQICHGGDFTGGVAEVSCFTASTISGACHVRNGVPVNAPHAPIPWLTYPSPTHTSTVDDASGLNAAVCAMCHTHGNNLRTPIITTYATGTPGCFNSTLCHGTVGHPPGWAQPSMHGAAAKANLTLCQQCHADNPTGGPGSNPRFNVQLGRLVNGSTTGCEVCHAPLAAHPRVLQIPAVFGVITTITPIGTPWYLHCTVSPANFDACTHCHGANLDGAGAAAGATGCTFCHLNRVPTTVMDCASCHSQPPNGTSYPNTAGVHASHGALNVAVVCDACHTGLGSITLDHFNRAKARTGSLQAGAVVFGALASTGGLAPAYNATTQQCTNTYCHGNTLDKPATAILSPSWNAPFLTGVASSDCTKCHGYPPTTVAPHTSSMTPTQCIGCHPHVNASGTGFTDPTKHINGVIDATSGAAHQFPYPGSIHLSAAVSPFTTCLGCHTDNKTTNYPYPPAAGLPPDCQGCHVKAPPGNGCGSCHGSSSTNSLTNGRPNGSAFPDVAGQHNRGEHNVACSTCHSTAGTGQTTHGNSNFILHNDANVIITLPSSGNTITYTRSGLGDGHGSCSGSCNGESHTNAGNKW